MDGHTELKKKINYHAGCSFLSITLALKYGIKKQLMTLIKNKIRKLSFLFFYFFTYIICMRTDEALKATCTLFGKAGLFDSRNGSVVQVDWGRRGEYREKSSVLTFHGVMKENIVLPGGTSTSNSENNSTMALHNCWLKLQNNWGSNWHHKINKTDFSKTLRLLKSTNEMKTTFQGYILEPSVDTLNTVLCCDTMGAVIQI